MKSAFSPCAQQVCSIQSIVIYVPIEQIYFYYKYKIISTAQIIKGNLVWLLCSGTSPLTHVLTDKSGDVQIH